MKEAFTAKRRGWKRHKHWKKQTGTNYLDFNNLLLQTSSKQTHPTHQLSVASNSPCVFSYITCIFFYSLTYISYKSYIIHIYPPRLSIPTGKLLISPFSNVSKIKTDIAHFRFLIIFFSFPFISSFLGKELVLKDQAWRSPFRKASMIEGYVSQVIFPLDLIREERRWLLSTKRNNGQIQILTTRIVRDTFKIDFFFF